MCFKCHVLNVVGQFDEIDVLVGSLWGSVGDDDGVISFFLSPCDRTGGSLLPSLLRNFLRVCSSAFPFSHSVLRERLFVLLDLNCGVEFDDQQIFYATVFRKFATIS